MKFVVHVTVSLCGLMCAVGCGSSASGGPSAESLVAVKGKVMLDNAPADGVVLTFVPTDAALSDGVSAVTDEKGEYEAKTHGATGAMPGSYRVVASRLLDPSRKPVVATPDKPPADLGAFESIPTRYSDYAASTLNVKVGPQGGTFDFKLTSK